MSVLIGGWGCGGGGRFVFTTEVFWRGRFGGGGRGAVGDRAGSENDTLLPVTMTHDWRKFRNDLPWRSKVIVRKP